MPLYSYLEEKHIILEFRLDSARADIRITVLQRLLPRCYQDLRSLKTVAGLVTENTKLHILRLNLNLNLLNVLYLILIP